MSSKWMSSLLLLVLVSCASPAPQQTQLPEPIAWRVQITPTLTWMGPLMNACAPMDGQYNVLVEERPFNSLQPSQADITLSWGAPQALPDYTFELGRDALSLIVHPENTLVSLSETEWQSIYQGRILKWKTIQPDLEKLDNIQLVTFDTKNDIEKTMSVISGGMPSSQSTALIAPHSLAARDFVATHPSAIGYLPDRWLDPGVRRVNLQTNQPERLEQPILALLDHTPTTAQQQWLQCMTLAIQTAR